MTPTPALARATDALVNEPLPRENDGSFSPERYATNLARAVVSAALHDPDDPDALPREYVARLARESRKTRCARVCWHAKWDDLAEPDRDVIRAQIDAMTAAILGSGS